MKAVILAIIAMFVLAGCQNIGQIVEPQEDITQEFINDTPSNPFVEEPVVEEPVVQQPIIEEPIVTTTPLESLDDSIKELDLLDTI